MKLPAIGPVAASFSQSFCGTSSSLVISRPVKLKTKNDDLQQNMSLLKKMNDSNLHFLSQPTIAAGYE